MKIYTKKYANGQQKSLEWRKSKGIKVGKKKFDPRPSSHAAKRKAK